MLESAKHMKFPHEGEQATAMMFKVHWYVDRNGETYNAAVLEIYTEVPKEDPFPNKLRRYVMRLADVPTEASIDDTIFHLTEAPDLSMYEVEIH